MIDASKAAKLIRMLSSPNQGEVINAARMLCKMDIHKVAARIETGSSTVYDQADNDDLRDEVERLEEVIRRMNRSIDKRVTKATCVVCKHVFLAGRSDAKTCSPKCRTARHRQLG
jgi:hypothetical protein